MKASIHLKSTFFSLALAMFGGLFAAAQPVPSARPSFPNFESLPVQPGLPDPLRLMNGERVGSADDWFGRARPELKGLFQHYMYGHWPSRPARARVTIERVQTNYLDGSATKKEITLGLGPSAPALHLLLVTPHRPRKASGPAPAPASGRSQRAPIFLGLNFCGNHTLVTDPELALPAGWMPASCPGVTNNHATDAGRGAQKEVWALDQTINRGYGLAVFYYGDVEPDRAGAKEGIRGTSGSRGGGKETYDWGAVAAWAWGVQCAIDYLETDGDVDPKRIAVVGHSRNGKAALVAAAFDERIALVIPHQAGCGGTAPSRGTVGESVKQINDRFPHWFNDRFKEFNDHPEKLPFDQHELVALVAPRPVLLSNAIEDSWANPGGQFEMLKAAEPVYLLLKAGRLEAETMPPPGELSPGKLGFYIRPGKHSMTRDDWKVFLDYADKWL